MTIQMSYSEVRQKLAAAIDRAVDDRETVIITRRGKPAAALIAADELSSLKETVYLLRSPANARRLFEAMEEIERGAGVRMSVDELSERVERGAGEAAVDRST